MTMRRTIDRGKPLEELVKGSLEYTRYALWHAFRQSVAAAGGEPWEYALVDTFADALIITSYEQPPDEFYRVPYTREGEGYAFAPQADWETVELSYTPARIPVRESSHQPGTRVRLDHIGTIHLVEAAQGQPRRLRGIALTADSINANRRRYAAPVVEAAVARANARKLVGGTAGRADHKLLGEVEHPSDKGGMGVPSYLENVAVWDRITFDGRQVTVEGRLIETAKGRDALAIMDAGVLPGLSIRAWGYVELVKEDGIVIEEVVEFDYEGIDLVASASDYEALAIVESRGMTPKKESQVAKLDLNALRGEYPELVAQIEKEHDDRKRQELEEALQARQREDAERQRIINEANAALRKQLGLNETEDLAAALATREAERQRLVEADAQRQVREYIEAETKDLKYPANLKARFVEAIISAKPTKIEEAKAAIVAKRREYDALMADVELAGKGHPGILQILGPVLERDRGVPEFARTAFELTESMVRGGHARPRDLRQAKTPNERFAALYLASFDRAYQTHLLAEARVWAEATDTAGLNLPYSVARTVMAEALPELVALSVFDVQMVDPQPSVNIYYERYAAETGAVVTVTDAVLTAPATLGDWVNLSHKRLIPGTVVVTSSPAGTTYVEGTHYVIDYLNGRFTALATITAGQSLLIDYQYDAIRKGEGTAIERAKMHLDFVAVRMAADRLAAQITSEAIVFSRGAMDWDVTGRTLARLASQVNRKIDSGLFYLGLSASLRVANNSAGTWTKASDTLDKLVELIGGARVKIANRFYTPTAVLMSITNSDILSNSDLFTAAGQRPDMDLTAEGYTGRVKGLPVFQSTNYPDGYIQVVNRELVAHRIGQPMQFRGPFQSMADDATGRLVASEEWYAEEYNASETPVPEKSAHIKIA